MPLPPSDRLGLDVVEVMLLDVGFPATKKGLLNTTGSWLVPFPGGQTLPLAELLHPLRDRTYLSRRAVLNALWRAWPQLRPTRP